MRLLFWVDSNDRKSKDRNKHGSSELSSSRIRKKHSPEFKLKAVVEVLKGEKTAAQLAGELDVHPMTLSEWKKTFMENGAQLFEREKKNQGSPEEKEKTELFQQIGRLKMGLKKLGPLQVV